MALLDELKKYFALKGEVISEKDIIQLISSKPKPLKLTDPSPTENGNYIPIDIGTYANAGGLIYEPETIDKWKAVEFFKTDKGWTKNSYKLPIADTSEFATGDEVKEVATGILNLDLANIYKKERVFLPKDKTGDIFIHNPYGTGFTYFEGTTVNVGERLLNVNVTAERDGTIHIKLFTINDDKATFLHSAGKAVFAGKNTFTAQSLGFPASLNNVNYYVGVSPDESNLLRSSSNTGGLGIIDTDNNVSNAPLSGCLWIYKETNEEIVQEYVLSSFPEVKELTYDIFNLRNPKIKTAVPYDKSDLEFNEALGPGNFYGAQSLKSTPEKFYGLTFKVVGTSGTIKLLFKQKIGGVWSTFHTFTKSISTINIVNGNVTILRSEISLPATNSEFFVFLGSTDSTIVRYKQGGTAETWWTELPSGEILEYVNNPVVTFPLWILELAESEEGIVSEVLKLKGSKWINKKGVTFGDSITWYDDKYFSDSHIQRGQYVKGYQSYLRSELVCEVVNQGESGWTMPQIMARLKAFDFSNTDFATITSGANDHRLNVQPGIVGSVNASFDTSTYAGAMQSSIEFILSQNKKCKIYLITPIKGFFIDTSGVYKNEPLLSRDYVDVVLELGRLYSIPVCNWYDESFINDINRTYYIGDDPEYPDIPYFLHPTLAGFRLMGEMIAAFIKYF